MDSSTTSLALMGREVGVLNTKLSQTQGIGNKINVFKNFSLIQLNEQLNKDTSALTSYNKVLAGCRNSQAAFNLTMKGASDTAKDYVKSMGTAPAKIDEYSEAQRIANNGTKALTAKPLFFLWMGGVHTHENNSLYMYNTIVCKSTQH